MAFSSNFASLESIARLICYNCTADPSKLRRFLHISLIYPSILPLCIMRYATSTIGVLSHVSSPKIASTRWCIRKRDVRTMRKIFRFLASLRSWCLFETFSFCQSLHWIWNVWKTLYRWSPATRDYTKFGWFGRIILKIGLSATLVQKSTKACIGKSPHRCIRPHGCT